MKYIITESRLNSLVSNYLDQMDWWKWDIGDGEFNLADGKFESTKILFRIQYSSTMPDHYFDIIYLSDGLVTNISKLFSISSENSIKMIIDWFNKRYDKSLTMDNFEWMDHEDQNEED
jgi:hypothetical protein